MLYFFDNICNINTPSLKKCNSNLSFVESSKSAIIITKDELVKYYHEKRKNDFYSSYNNTSIINQRNEFIIEYNKRRYESVLLNRFDYSDSEIIINEKITKVTNELLTCDDLNIKGILLSKLSKISKISVDITNILKYSKKRNLSDFELKNLKSLLSNLDDIIL